MFDVSPPKPCRYADGSGERAWLNSTSGSPRETMSGIAAEVEVFAGVDVAHEHAGSFAREPRALAVAPVDQAIAQVALAHDGAVLVAQVDVRRAVDDQLHDVAGIRVVRMIRADRPR